MIITAGKCDDEKQLKPTIKTSMVSTNEGITDNSQITASESGTTKENISIKPLHQEQKHQDIHCNNLTQMTTLTI